MTKEEIRKILDNTKVYVNGKSKEIQEKLFSFGYIWGSRSKIVNNTDKPFLFIHNDKTITYGDDMNYFREYKKKEITAEEILSIELTEPLYREFKIKEECWNEMLKHQPFGWVRSKVSGIFYPIESVTSNIYFNKAFTSYEEAFECIEFIDGTPFGIKEE